MRRAAAWTAAAVVTAASLPAALPISLAQAAAPTYYRPADGVLHLAGHGFGHGHGMSQWGAYGGAQSGKSYQQILSWYFGSATFGTAGGSIKVQITSDGRNGDGSYDTQVKPAGGLTAVDQAGDTLALPTADPSGKAYDVFRALLQPDGTFRVQAHNGSTWTSLAPTGTGKTPTSWTGWVRFSASGGILDLIRSGGSTEYYRDTLELDKTSSGSGITVNQVSLEHYLAGVVSSEMPCGWTPTVNGARSLAALESQAVAARSYAAWRRQHPRSGQVDIVDNTSDQAYHGYSAEKTALTECPWTNADGSKTSAEVAAVNATAGQVLVDGNGNPIFAQYSASNGGFETAGGASYLPSRPDAWDGVPTDSWNSHSWTGVTVTAGQIEAAYRSIGSFASLTVDSRESLSGIDQNGHKVGEQWGGRITSLTLNGSAGSVTTSGAAFAGALGLMSPWFTVVVQRPTAPTSVSAAPGDTQATVSWAPPSSDGGGGIRGYTITASPAITPVTVSGTARSAVVTGLTNDRPYVFSVAATNTAGTGGATSASAVTPSARVVFHPLPPTRILDTRSRGGAIGAGKTRSVRVTGVGGVPASGVVDVALDVVSIDPTATSSLSVYPHGGHRPATAQLSWTKGQRVNTLVWVKVGSGGSVDLTNATGSTQVFVDVQGYYTQASDAGDVLTAAPSYKLFDSRPSHRPVASGSTTAIQVIGRGGVPAGATAAVVQLTAASPTQRDYIRAWGGGAARPGAYDVYAPAHLYSSATAIVPLTSAGTMNVSPTYATHLIVSLEGWFTTSTSPAAGVTSLITPTHRVVRASLGAGATKTVSLGLPSGAAAAIVTLVATGPTGTPVSVWATGQSAPSIASLHLRGSWVRTSRVVAVGSGGKVTIRNSGRATVQVILDTAGWA